MRENNKIIVAIVMILIFICGIIIFKIGYREHNYENKIINNITEKQNTEKENLLEFENYMTNTINNKVVDNGIITNIENNTISIQNDEIDYPYEINIDNETLPVFQ